MKKIEFEQPINTPIDKFSNALEKKLGLTLVAKDPEDIVNGYINTYIKGDRRVFEVNIYTYNEDPTFEEFYYKDRVIERGRKSTIREPVDIENLTVKANDII